MKKTKLHRKSRNPITIARSNAINAFNAFVRARDMVLLKGKCYTCGRLGNQAGHFIHSSNAVRFIENACHLQCATCNLYKSGNLVAYTLRMIKDYGIEYVKELRRLGAKPKYISLIEFRKITEIYKKKLESLKTIIE